MLVLAAACACAACDRAPARPSQTPDEARPSGMPDAARPGTSTPYVAGPSTAVAAPGGSPTAGPRPRYLPSLGAFPLAIDAGQAAAQQSPAADPALDAASDTAPDGDRAGAGTDARTQGSSPPSMSVAPGSPTGRTTLLSQAIGFGRRARGGLDGPTARVTTLADDGPGSLRALAEDASGPRWIVFDVDGVIRLTRAIAVAADTTIDGRGRRVELTGHGLDIDGVGNIVVTNLILRRGDGDAVAVRRGAHDVWLHHLTLQAWTDGLVDVQRAGTDVTVSWSHFLDHEKVMLLGADSAHESDADIRVTLHHNLFERTGQRHPRLRWGRAHAFNNVLWHWQSYGMAADHHGQLLVEANVFDPGPDAEEAVKVEAADGVPGRIRAVGNLVLGDVPLAENAPETVFDPRASYPYVAEVADEALVARVRMGAGWQR